MYLKFFILCILFVSAISVCSAEDSGFQSVTELRDFLEADSTNDKKYVFPWHMCGDFTDDLIHNASLEGYTINRMLKSDNFLFMSPKNHIFAYVTINGITYYIEPQHDSILCLDQSWYYMKFNTKINPITFIQNIVK